MRVTEVGGMKIFGLDAEGEDRLRKREAFVLQYCKEHGLKKEELTIPQILELRKEEGWKNPA